MTLTKTPFENIVGKGENAGNLHFLVFPHNVSTRTKTKTIILETLTLSSASALNFVLSPKLSFGKVLTFYHTIPTFNDPK